MLPKNKTQPLLDPKATLAFYDLLTAACLTFRYDLIEYTLKKYLDATVLLDCKEFLEQAKVLTDDYRSKHPTMHVIKSRFYESKCTFCFFGNTVRGFELLYSFQKTFPMVVYTHRMALHVVIKDQCLVDFNWCNVFLSGKEVVALHNQDL